MDVPAERSTRTAGAPSPSRGMRTFPFIREGVAANPARIIPAWRDFVASVDGRGHARGIGEPIWAERTPAELVECQRHETLLNLAFAGVPAWWLLIADRGAGAGLAARGRRRARPGPTATAATGCGWSTSSATWSSCAASPTVPSSGSTCT
jgi:MEDS: MEthanogen/methylotroph, DcmR Sensory domain